LKKVQYVHQNIEPLLRNQKQLSAKQKEQATELLYNAAEMQEQLQQKIAVLTRQQDLAQAKACAELAVSSLLNAGVTIRFPHVETPVAAPLRGPLRVVCRHVNNAWQILVLAPSGSSLPLESRPTADHTLDTL